VLITVFLVHVVPWALALPSYGPRGGDPSLQVRVPSAIHEYYGDAG
jgi:hypothetical protein